MLENELTAPIQADNLEVISGVKHLPEFIKFAEWTATPKQSRIPRTMKEFANENAISQDSLTDWKKRPEFWPLAQQFMSNWLKERIPDVLQGLYFKASAKGNAREVEMYFRLAGMPINKPNRKKDEKS